MSTQTSTVVGSQHLVLGFPLGRPDGIRLVLDEQAGEYFLQLYVPVELLTELAEMCLDGLEEIKDAQQDQVST